MKRKIPLSFITTLFFPTIFGVPLAGEPSEASKQHQEAMNARIKASAEQNDSLLHDKHRKEVEACYNDVKRAKRELKSCEEESSKATTEALTNYYKELILLKKERLAGVKLTLDNKIKQYPQDAKDFFEAEVKRLQEELDAVKKLQEGVK